MRPATLPALAKYQPVTNHKQDQTPGHGQQDSGRYVLNTVHIILVVSEFQK
jgi:hypothetical protein